MLKLTIILFIHSPCMYSDLSYRLDYYGKKILGNKYKKDKITNKLKNFYNHIKSTPILKLYFIIGLLLLLIIFYCNHKIGSFLIILLIVFIIIIS